MLTQAPRSLAGWTSAFADLEIPVLRDTALRIGALAESPEGLSARQLADIILGDPLMTTRVFAEFAKLRRGRSRSAITKVEGVIVMMGMPRFLEVCAALPTVEDHLAEHSDALAGLMSTIDRARTAARLSWDFAVWRNDLDCEELSIAALLHDVAEILVWTFAPTLALATRETQRQDLHHRSANAQQHVLHILLPDLQQSLVNEWGLPEMLVTMMDDRNATDRRVKNVRIAVNIARHSIGLSARGTIGPALAQDYLQAAQLLNVTQLRVREIAEAHTLGNSTTNDAPPPARGS